MKKLRDTLSEFIIIRVSVNEKLDLRKRSQDMKNLSKWVRKQLGLKDEK